MSLRGWLLKALGAEVREAPQMVESFQVGQPVRIASEVADLTDAYRLIPTAFRAVSVIAGTASKLPITVYRSRKGNDEAIAEHPLSEMLHPDCGVINPWTSSLTGWSSVFAYQQLVGNAYLFKDRLFRGTPTEIHVLRPDWVRPIPGRQQMVDGYEYGPPGLKATTYGPEEIIPFPLFNPTSPLIGQSPLLPAREAMVLELYMVALNTAFFKNGATLGGVISFEKGIPRDTVAAFMEAFNSAHRGAKNAHKWRGAAGAQEIKELGLSNRELQYAEGLKWTQQSVCTALGVPIMMLGVLDGATFANSKEQKAIFYENTIQPLTALRDAQINLHLAPAFGKDIYVRTDYTNVDALLPEMAEVRQTAGDAFAKNAISRDEYRQWLKTRRTPDLEPMDAAPVFFSDLTPSMSVGPIPADDPNADTAPADPPVDDNVQKAMKDAMDRAWRAAKKDKAAKVNGRVDKHVGKFQEVVGRIFGRQEEEIRKGIGQLSLTDLSRLDGLIAKASSANEADMREGMQELTKLFGQQVMADLGLAQAAFDASSPRVLRYIAEEAGKKIRFLDKTTADAVRHHIQSAIASAIAEGSNMVETATAIIEAGIDGGMEIRRGRANAIAQTETTAAYNHADLEAYRQSDLVEEREWVSQGADGHTRPSHLEMTGAVAKLDEPFVFPSGDRVMFPGDSSLGADPSEIIECRCYTMPILKRSLNADRLRTLSENIQKLRATTPAAHLNGKGKGTH